MRLLLVEDDRLLGDGIKEGLIDAGYTVDWLTDGESARSALLTQRTFDAVVLDIGLPRLDGLQLLGWMRSASPPAQSSTKPELSSPSITTRRVITASADKVSEHFRFKSDVVWLWRISLVCVSVHADTSARAFPCQASNKNAPSSNDCIAVGA